MTITTFLVDGDAVRRIAAHIRHMAREDRRSRPARAKMAAERRVEVGRYVIERGCPGQPFFVQIRDDLLGWTSTSSDAARFPNQAAAERFAAARLGGDLRVSAIG